MQLPNNLRKEIIAKLSLIVNDIGLIKVLKNLYSIQDRREQAGWKSRLETR